MRFPAQLTLALMRERIARAWSGSRIAERFQFVDAGEILHPDSAHPVSREKFESILAEGKPFVWIGGGEPLDHAGIAHLVRAVAERGRFVFLETSGVALRRRIHEFPPVSQVIFAVRLEGAGLERCSDTRNASACTLALEGIRAAQLSGFWTAIHSRLSETAEPSEFEQFASQLRALDIDGWLVTAAHSKEAALRKAAETRGRIPHAQWRRLSEIVEQVLLTQKAIERAAQAPLPETATAASEMPGASLALAAQAEASREGVAP